jgi:catechol-2,3-dioxygenase
VQHDFDLHIALAVEPVELEAMLDKGKAEGREVRGPIDHGFIRSIYFRDPNGYVIELTTPTAAQGELIDPARSRAHDILARWEEAKAPRRV